MLRLDGDGFSRAIGGELLIFGRLELRVDAEA